MTSAPKRQTTNTNAFIDHLRQLRDDRRHRPRIGPTAKRLTLTRAERTAVAAKTDGRCHICGGVLGSSWEADHVLAHATGGRHQLDNYLPAHALCNNYRWHYSPEEFQWVLKIGVWARLIMEQDTPLGQQLADQFYRYEGRRIRRRKLT